MHTPENARELAEKLHWAAQHERTVSLCGHGSKRGMGGPAFCADEPLSTRAMCRVLQYEPYDLTASVEAGMPWGEFCRVLEANRQMVPLDPPFAGQATVGGVVAANCSGPRRLLFGTARDVVIGMQFATTEGKLVQSGGMVVKNVAGLDMAKLMIGSFGTLAAIAVVNFKVAPMPEAERSFLLPFASAADAVAARDRILSGALQPASLDLLNPPAAATLGNRAWVLAVRAGGNPEAMERYERELSSFEGGVAFDDERQDRLLWRHVQEFTPVFLDRHTNGAVVRVSCTLKKLEPVMASFEGPAVARAGTGVCYGYFAEVEAAADWMRDAVERKWRAVMEFAPEDWKRGAELWPAAGADLELMRRLKQLFDPGNVLNRGRLYGRI